MKRLTTEEFIQKAKEIHGDKKDALYVLKKFMIQKLLFKKQKKYMVINMTIQK